MSPSEYAVSLAAPTLKSVVSNIIGKFDWDVLGSTEHSNVGCGNLHISPASRSVFSNRASTSQQWSHGSELHSSLDYSPSKWQLKCDYHPLGNHLTLPFNSTISLYLHDHGTIKLIRGASGISVHFVFNIWFYIFCQQS